MLVFVMKIFSQKETAGDNNRQVLYATSLFFSRNHWESKNLKRACQLETGSSMFIFHFADRTSDFTLVTIAR